MNGNGRLTVGIDTKYYIQIRKSIHMTKSESNAQERTRREGKTTLVTTQKSILSHLNILDLEEEGDVLDDYDC